jgi:DNA-binding MarR family transcriptional regulator
MRLIWALDHALQRTSKRMRGRLGITGPQRLVIRIAGRFPGIPPGQLAALLHLHPSTLSGVLKRLERQGLIDRRPDPRDRRRAFIGLTEKGRRLDVASGRTLESAVAEVIARVPSTAVGHAREVLSALTERLREMEAA